MNVVTKTQLCNQLRIGLRIYHILSLRFPYIINLNVYLLRTQMRRRERNPSTGITIHNKRIIFLYVLLNNIPDIKRFSHKICLSKLNFYLVSRTKKEELLW
jgi:hypothetical protein